MFRDPRTAKRATGILASSAPLMTAAQKAMAQGQPMRAQSGRSVNTQNRTLLEDLALLPTDVGDSLARLFSSRSPEASPQSRIEEYRPMRPNLPTSVLSQLAGGIGDVDFDRLGRSLEASLAAPIFAAPGTAAAMSPMQRDAYDKSRGELRRQGNPMLRRGPMDVAPGSGITSVAPATTPSSIESTIDFSSAGPSDMLSRNASDVAPEGRSQGLSAAQRMLLEKKTAGDQTASDIAPGAGENLADQTPTSSALSAVKKAVEEDAQANEEQKVLTPEETDTKPDAAADISAAKSAGKGVTSTQEQADANDDLLGIPKEDNDGKKLSRKERNQLRYEELVAMVGEDKAKDIRTDKSYNLMMLGLRIAAGQSENALTNIAVGAGQQLEEFGEVSGELSQKKADQLRALKLQAVNEVGAEIAREEERKFATSERLDTQTFQRAMQDDRIGSQEAMKAVELQWKAAESALGRELTSELAAADRTFRLKLQEIQSLDRQEDREAAYKRLVATHQFQADQAAEGRIFDLEKTLAAQDFAVEQGLNEQAFRLTLADFTAKLPTGTQALYEKYLKPEQIAGVIMAGVTGNTAKAPSQEAFALGLLENPDAYDSIKRDIANSFDPPLDPKTVTRDQVIDGIGAMYNQIKNYVAPASN